MKLIKRVHILSVFIGLLICFVYFLTKYLFPKSYDSSTENLYYLPNETYCPIPTFPDKSILNLQLSNQCEHETKDWINMINNYAIFNQSVISKVGIIDCHFKNIVWKTDFEALLSSEWKRLLNNSYLGSDTLLVRCKGQSLFHYYEQFLFGFENKNSGNNEDHLKDILIVGIDSVSRLAWKRLLRQSYDFISNEMADSAVIFKKANVLGDGTTVNLMGLLAGELEMDVYESRRGYPNAKSVDDYPWIWNYLKTKKYATYFDEDDVPFGSFQYRLLGFERQPTDFYGRIWRMIRNRRKHSSLCINHRNIFDDQLHNVMLFFQTMKFRKFVFLFSTYFSHDTNENVAILDKSLLELLKNIKKPDSMFNNTIFILMSDHGHRFNSRLHLQGKIEERLPFLAMHLPKSLIDAKPEILQNLKKNENKLITTFDVYETMKDMVNNFTYTKGNQSDIHSMSLFYDNIPLRNCPDVKIASHWCSCLKMTEVNIDLQIIQDALKYAVNTINDHVEEYRQLCHRLLPGKVLRAHLVAPSQAVLGFHNSDRHGRIPNMSDNKNIDNFYYRIAFQTTPGNAIFESTISVHIRNKKIEFSINIADIDRSNRYSSWIWCLKNGMKDIRKYCLCK